MSDEYIKRLEAIRLTDEVTKDTTCPIHIAAEIEQVLSQAPAADVEPVNRWISVDERLPEKEGAYLIFTTIYFIPDHVDECDHYDGIEISGFHPVYGFGSKNGRYAKAWQPLPEPPKGAEK